MEKPLASRRKPASLASLLMHTSMSSGSRESEHTALAVIPWICSPSAVATTVTPVANNPAVRRNSAVVIPVMPSIPGSSARWSFPALRSGLLQALGQELPNPIHVGRHVVCLEQGSCHAFRIAEEVPLVEYLPRPEGGEGGVPGQPEEGDALLGVGAGGLVELFDLFGHRPLQIGLGGRRHEPAGAQLLDDLHHARVQAGGQVAGCIQRGPGGGPAPPL